MDASGAAGAGAASGAGGEDITAADSLLWVMVGGGTLSFLLAIIARAIYVLYQIRKCRKYSRSFCFHERGGEPIRTLVVLGSGGHTAEMLALIAPLRREDYAIEFCKADTDTTSAQRLSLEQRGGAGRDGKRRIHDIPRSREVGQSYLTSVLTTLRAQAFAFGLVYRTEPRLVLCNGPGTCLPVCVAALFWRIIGVMPGTRIVFVESLCRVQTLSLTGKLLYPIADMFCVHWPELHSLYPSSQRIQTFIVDQDKKQ